MTASAATTTVTVGGAIVSGKDHFSYSNDWKAETGPDTAKWLEGTEHWANSTPEPFASFTFTGTKVRLFGAKDASHGIDDVSIDKGQPQQVDAYAATRLDQQLIFTSDTLAPGSHTLTLTLTGEHNPAAEDRASGQIDCAEVDEPVVPATGVRIEPSRLDLIVSQTAQVGQSAAPTSTTSRPRRSTTISASTTPMSSARTTEAGRTQPGCLTE